MYFNLAQKILFNKNYFLLFLFFNFKKILNYTVGKYINFKKIILITKKINKSIISK